MMYSAEMYHKMLKNRGLIRDFKYQNMILIAIALATIAFKFTEEFQDEKLQQAITK